MSKTKRKVQVVDGDDVPKHWAKNPAFYHWKKQAQDCATKVQELIQHEQHLDVKVIKLQQNYQQEMADLEKRHKKQMENVHQEQRQNMRQRLDAQSQGKTAEIRCKDPIFQHLSSKFPLSILEMLIDYNANEICKSCMGYFPHVLRCVNTKGHYGTFHSQLTITITRKYDFS